MNIENKHNLIKKINKDIKYYENLIKILTNIHLDILTDVFEVPDNMNNDLYENIIKEYELKNIKYQDSNFYENNILTENFSNNNSNILNNNLNILDKFKNENNFKNEDIIKNNTIFQKKSSILLNIFLILFTLIIILIYINMDLFFKILLYIKMWFFYTNFASYTNNFIMFLNSHSKNMVKYFKEIFINLKYIYDNFSDLIKFCF